MSGISTQQTMERRGESAGGRLGGKQRIGSEGSRRSSTTGRRTKQSFNYPVFTDIKRVSFAIAKCTRRELRSFCDLLHFYCNARLHYTGTFSEMILSAFATFLARCCFSCFRVFFCVVNNFSERLKHLICVHF